MSSIGIHSERFDILIGSAEIESIRHADSRDRAVTIWDRIVDMFTGSNKAEAKRLLFDLFHDENATDFDKLSTFNELKKLVQPEFQASFVIDRNAKGAQLLIERGTGEPVEFGAVSGMAIDFHRMASNMFPEAGRDKALGLVLDLNSPRLNSRDKLAAFNELRSLVEFESQLAFSMEEVRREDGGIASYRLKAGDHVAAILPGEWGDEWGHFDDGTPRADFVRDTLSLFPDEFKAMAAVRLHDLYAHGDNREKLAAFNELVHLVSTEARGMLATHEVEGGGYQLLVNGRVAADLHMQGVGCGREAAEAHLNGLVAGLENDFQRHLELLRGEGPRAGDAGVDVEGSSVDALRVREADDVRTALGILEKDYPDDHAAVMRHAEREQAFFLGPVDLPDALVLEIGGKQANIYSAGGSVLSALAGDLAEGTYTIGGERLHTPEATEGTQRLQAFCGALVTLDCTTPQRNALLALSTQGAIRAMGEYCREDEGGSAAGAVVPGGPVVISLPDPESGEEVLRSADAFSFDIDKADDGVVSLRCRYERTARLDDASYEAIVTALGENETPWCDIAFELRIDREGRITLPESPAVRSLVPPPAPTETIRV